MQSKNSPLQATPSTIAKSLSAMGDDPVFKSEFKPLSGNLNSHSFITGIDLNAVRLPKSFIESIEVKSHKTRVPVRKALNTEFFRVRQGEEWRLQTMILELKQEREMYIVTPAVWDAIPDVIKPAVLHLAINRMNNLFLIPVQLPGPDGRRLSWHESLSIVVNTAETEWVRSVANHPTSTYNLTVAQGKIADPEWPDVTFQEVIEIAFRGRVIDSIDHPVIRQLKGEC